MPFALGAAHAPSVGDWLSPGLSPRLDQGSYHILDARDNSTTANATVNMFIDSEGSDYEYAASIVTACVDQTVYALQCTAGPSNVGSETCGPNAVIATVTSAASFYSISSAVTTETLGYDVTGTVQETCSLAGTTAAACTGTLKATAESSTVSTSTVETLSGSDYYRFNVEITGGSEKTANPTATCRAKGAATSLNTKKMAMWALAGVIGVAGIQTML
ncbi:hypothetical protein N431DRAFT_413964 [Stipitochalara longipes BDJ]|nr:hypothetical protein N431DRAFT_413964 [Stipitochalara longipes BDJ]